MTAHDRLQSALRGVPTRTRGRRRLGTREAPMDRRANPHRAPFTVWGDDLPGLALALKATAGTHDPGVITAGWRYRDIMANRLVMLTRTLIGPDGPGNHLDRILTRTHTVLTERTPGYAVVSREVSWWVACYDTDSDYFPQGWVRLDPADVTALHTNPRDWFTRFWPFDTGQLLCQVSGLCVPLSGERAA